MSLSSVDSYAGIDVSKSRLDVATVPERDTASFANDATGWKQLVVWLQARGSMLAIVESTGGYEKQAVAALWAADLAVRIINPLHARNFARAEGLLAKTDALDAALLARFGLAMRLTAQTPIPQERQALQELVARRHQLTDMRTAELHRQEHLRTPSARRSVDAILNAIHNQLQSLNDQIDDTINAHPLWQEQQHLLHTVPGVKDQTSRELLANLPELGALHRRQIAKLAGLAPHNHDSGQFRGHRHIAGGRPGIRKALYLATLSATRSNPRIRALHQRLKAQAKPTKVILIACARKLLTILNAILKTQTPFQECTP